MIKITEKDLELLAFLLVSKKASVRNFLKKFFKNAVVNKHSILVESEYKGNIALVSHYDTVHNDNRDRELIWDKDKNIFWSPDGLGADDRAGVWANIMIWKYCKENNLPLPVLIFTDLEEVGGIGATEVSELHIDSLKELNFLIEIDRKGREEAVFYNEETEEFKEFILSFGFKEKTGSFSDITTIGLYTNLCSVNLSAGYYEQHTKTEHLRLNDLLYTINKVIEIIKENNKKYTLPDVIKVEKNYYDYGFYDYGFYDYYGYNCYNDSIYDTNTVYDSCVYCGLAINMKEDTYYLDNMDGIYCEHCVERYSLFEYEVLEKINNKKEKKKEKKKKNNKKDYEYVVFDKEDKLLNRNKKVLKTLFKDSDNYNVEFLTLQEVNKILKYAFKNNIFSLKEVIKYLNLYVPKKEIFMEV